MFLRGFLILTVLWVSPVFAQTQTYYEILKEYFDLAADPLMPEYIYDHAHPDAPFCVETNELNQNQNQSVYISKVTKTKDQLGPKLPKITTTKVIYWTSGGAIPEYVFDEVELNTVSSEIQIAQKTPETFTLNLRRSGDFLYFHRIVSYRDEQNRLVRRNYYGYCYPRNQSLSSILVRSEVSSEPNSEPSL